MSDDSIQLHPKKGLNPRLTYCRRCRGEANEIILLGRHDTVFTCTCGTSSFGSKFCLTCKSRKGSSRILEDNEKLPSAEFCDTCRVEVQEHAEIVRAGGVYWRCLVCRSEGVLRPSEFTDRVRKHLKVEPPDACGVALTAPECPVCEATVKPAKLE